MYRITKQTTLIACAVLAVTSIAAAQSTGAKESLYVKGCPGKATVLRMQSRVFVDLEELARITDGSLTFDKERIILTLPGHNAEQLADRGVRNAGFSRDFRRAAIEAMASIREWGGTLMVIVQTGYPVEKAMAGNTIVAHKSRAEEAVALASTAASTDDDNHGLELLRNEFNNVGEWSDRFIEARTSLSAASLTMSESPLTHDEEVQKTIRCGQFLAQMFAGSEFKDDSSCH